MQSAMGIIRSFRRFTRHTLITFEKMKKKEKPKEDEERVRAGVRGWMNFVIPEFASNIYATSATMGTISVAWQPLCSQPVLPLRAHSPPPSLPFLSLPIVTNSFSLLSFSSPLAHSVWLSRLVQSSIFASHWPRDEDEGRGMINAVNFE